jgi:hypothetical protein
MGIGGALFLDSPFIAILGHPVNKLWLLLRASHIQPFFTRAKNWEMSMGQSQWVPMVPIELPFVDVHPCIHK